jgi:hypothetical protein
MLMPNLMQKTMIACGLAGAMALAGAVPSNAAPLPSSTGTLTSANPDAKIDVRWRGGPGPLFAGAVIGGAVAAGAYGGGYYPYYGGGYYPYYGRPYPYYYGRPYYRGYRYGHYRRHW